MPYEIENNRNRYGMVAQALHWIVALLFVAAFAAVYFRNWFTEPGTATNLSALQLHLSIGISVLVFAGLRLWWRLRSRMMPDELPGSRLEHLGAKLVHVGLYGVMIAMPVTGYVGTGVDTDFFGIATVPRFADTPLFDVAVGRGMGLTFEEFERPIDWLHKTLGELLVLALVGLHVAAALYHQYIRRDDVMRRMLPRAKRNQGGIASGPPQPSSDPATAHQHSASLEQGS